jgi:hypothetical protein
LCIFDPLLPGVGGCAVRQLRQSSLGSPRSDRYNAQILQRPDPIAVKVKKKKQSSTPHPGRLGAESVWGPARASSARPAPLARARRSSGVQRQFRPLLFRPNFKLVKKTGDMHARRTYIYKKRRQTTLSVSRRRRAVMCFRRRISLPRPIFRRFLCRDSVLPLCPHSVSFTRF